MTENENNNKTMIKQSVKKRATVKKAVKKKVAVKKRVIESSRPKSKKRLLVTSDESVSTRSNFTAIFQDKLSSTNHLFPILYAILITGSVILYLISFNGTAF